MLRYVVLGLLRDERPYYGYALMREYRDATGVAHGTGNFYRELQRLLEEGLVRPVPNPEGSDPRRVPYVITAEGMGVVDRWLGSPVAVGKRGSEGMGELTLRAFIVARVGVRLSRTVLAQWREELWACRAKLQRRLRIARPIEVSEVGQEAPLLEALAGWRQRYAAADVELVERVWEALVPGDGGVIEGRRGTVRSG